MSLSRLHLVSFLLFILSFLSQAQGLYVLPYSSWPSYYPPKSSYTYPNTYYPYNNYVDPFYRTEPYLPPYQSYYQNSYYYQPNGYNPYNGYQAPYYPYGGYQNSYYTPYQNSYGYQKSYYPAYQNSYGYQKSYYPAYQNSYGYQKSYYPAYQDSYYSWYNPMQNRVGSDFSVRMGDGSARMVGKDAELMCTFPPNEYIISDITWSKPGSPVSPDMVYRGQFNRSPDLHSGSLFLRDVRPDDGGYYRCTAKAQRGGSIVTLYNDVYLYTYGFPRWR